ncbi:hypothetical protein [Amycolatopsis kentuckyensis]|uniref:hypothetical protein n=1 Tax=Amycolatopsis kentuckyensis TaxID=218823 RepID=UPI0035627FC0
MLTATTDVRPVVARLAELNDRAGRPTTGHPLAALTRAEQDEHHDLLNQLVYLHPDESNRALLAEYDRGLSSRSLLDYTAALLHIARRAIPAPR